MGKGLLAEIINSYFARVINYGLAPLECIGSRTGEEVGSSENMFLVIRRLPVLGPVEWYGIRVAVNATNGRVDRNTGGRRRVGPQGCVVEGGVGEGMCRPRNPALGGRFHLAVEFFF